MKSVQYHISLEIRLKGSPHAEADSLHRCRTGHRKGMPCWGWATESPPPPRWRTPASDGNHGPGPPRQEHTGKEDHETVVGPGILLLSLAVFSFR